MPYISSDAKIVVRAAREVHETCRRKLIGKRPLAVINESQAILRDEGITDVSILPSGMAGGGKYLVIKKTGPCH